MSKTLAEFMETAKILGESPGIFYPLQSREQKECTIRKCASPKKKAKRKAKQASQRRNRR